MKYRAAILLLAFLAGNTFAEEKPKKENADRYLLRFEFDNDLFFQSDSGFTAGWGFSWHSPARDSWEETSKASQWIGRIIPGLDATPGDDYKAKTSTGFSQQMQTPTDLSNPDLDLNDVPYAATLGGFFAWHALNNQRYRGFQLYAGVVGPAAQGEEIQTFMHDDMGFGPSPLGWDNQLSNEPLLNVNYEASEKIRSWGTQEAGKFSTDLSGGLGGGVGNYFTGAYTQIDWRFGWGVPQGFTPAVGGTGRAIATVPTVDISDRWSLYFSIMPRLVAYGYFVFYDGTLFADSTHPGVEYNHFPIEISTGIHFTKNRFGLHYTGTVYLEPVVDVPSGTRYDWGTISVEYMF